MKSITLKPRRNVFSISFAALTSRNTSHITYRYRMEGFDKAWSPEQVKREASYTNLAPGTYTFTVRASNHDGVPTGGPATSLQIIVLSPWWKTLWFKLCAILCTAAVIIIIVRIRFASLKRIASELEKRVEDRTRKLSELNFEHSREIGEREKAETQVKLLRGFIPICASCKKIRDDQGYWTQIEAYISEHSEAEFTHGICPDCIKKLYPSYLDNLDKEHS